MTEKWRKIEMGQFLRFTSKSLMFQKLHPDPWGFFIFYFLSIHGRGWERGAAILSDKDSNPDILSFKGVLQPLVSFIVRFF